MSKKITDKYQKLTEVQHVLARSGRYVGSINVEKKDTWCIENDKVKDIKVNIVPAFHKLFDEIISNSADHARTPEGKNLTAIDVTVKDNVISVYDNGGIPVELHPEYNQYIPDMIFGELRSGSNFSDDEDSLTTGQNGEGSSLVNIFSKSFLVETALNGKSFKMEYTNNLSERTDAKIGKSSKSYTRITYAPDFEKLNMTEITNDDLLMIERRTYEIAFTNPNLKVSFNGKKIDINTFEKFVKTYDKDSVFYEIDRWRLGVSHSKNGFNHISFVNSTPSFDGGTHIDYVVDKIVEAVRERIEKKTKQTIKPSEIKNNLNIMLDCNINNPRYNSQTKEKLITLPNQFGSQFSLDEKIIKKLLASKVVENIIEWAMRKKELEDVKAIEDHAKKVRSKGFHDIPKYRPATSKNRDECILLLQEGDSAGKIFLAASDPKTCGIFPLKGKPENTFSKSLSASVSDEFMNISRIMNLSLTKPDYSNMRYSKIVMCVDADCLVKGTQIVTKDGVKNIEDINPFELVKTHTGEFKKVERVQQSLKCESLSFVTNIGVIETSLNHKHIIIRDNAVTVVKAHEILLSDCLVEVGADVKDMYPYDANDFDPIKINKIVHDVIEKEFYDLTVEDNHTFFIDLNGHEVLTHNCDGYHIANLLILMFKKFWAPLLEEGKIQLFQTPTVICTYKGKKYNFIKESEYEDFIKDKKGYTSKYCKGLGSHNAKEFKQFLDDPNSYVTIDYESERDDDSIGLAFDSKRADDRKIWTSL